MDIFFTHRSITDIPLYNCSVVSESVLALSHTFRRPARGFFAFIFGVVFTSMYVLCLRVMLQQSFFSKACYKIMFYVGVYELGTVIIHDFFIAYALAYGVDFCDFPNVFFTLGCFYECTWAGASYSCLLLAFNRMLEIRRFKRTTIEFFFSSARTNFGCLVGLIYSFSFFFFNSPVIYNNFVGTTVPDPLNLEDQSEVKLRNTLMIINNFGLVVITFLMYGVFCLISYKNIRRLPDISEHHIRLQNQIFIQATLMCGFNFFFSVSYAVYVVLPQLSFLVKLVFLSYQYSIGLQAVIYLFFNQSIRSGVKDIIWGVLRIKRPSETTIDMRTDKNQQSTKIKVPIYSIQNSQSTGISSTVSQTG